MSRTKEKDAIKSGIIARAARELSGRREIEKSPAINKLGCFDSANKAIRKRKRRRINDRCILEVRFSEVITFRSAECFRSRHFGEQRVSPAVVTSPRATISSSSTCLFLFVSFSLLFRWLFSILRQMERNERQREIVCERYSREFLEREECKA